MAEQQPLSTTTQAARRPLGMAFRWAVTASLPLLPLVVGLTLLFIIDDPSPLSVTLVVVLMMALVIVPLLTVFTLWAFVAPHWRWLERPWSGLLAGAVLAAGAVMLLPLPRFLVLPLDAGPIGHPRSFLFTVAVMAVFIRLARWRRLGIAPGAFAAAPRVQAGTRPFAALATALAAVLGAGAAGIALATGSLVYERVRPQTDAEVWAAYRAAVDGPGDDEGMPEWRRIADAAGAVLERFPNEPEVLENRGMARVWSYDTIPGLHDLVLAQSMQGCGGGRPLLRRLSAGETGSSARAEVWRWYAGCQRERGHLYEAQSAYLRAVESGAESDTWYLRGVVRLTMGDTAAACVDRGRAFDGRQGPRAAGIALSPDLERACSSPERLEATRSRLARQKGVVASYHSDKGMGWVRPDDGGRSLFLHHSDVQGTDSDSIREGDRVEFDVAEATLGARTVNVRRLP
ncbi:MAG TPA: cold shock domain-containing protein [Longimicrobium sp.]